MRFKYRASVVPLITLACITIFRLLSSVSSSELSVGDRVLVGGCGEVEAVMSGLQPRFAFKDLGRCLRPYPAAVRRLTVNDRCDRL